MSIRLGSSILLASMVFTAPCISDESHPTGVIFHKETIYHSNGIGDGWSLTWAADDSQITAMNDGNWLVNHTTVTMPAGTPFYHHKLYRVIGQADGFSREDLPNYPDFSAPPVSWFGFGLISIDGVLYSAVSKTPEVMNWSTPMLGMKLLRSADNGRTWQRVNRQGQLRTLTRLDDGRDTVNAEEMFFFAEEGLPHRERHAYPFSWVEFVQRGRDNSEASDNYVYIYSPEGAHAHKLLLARVEKENLGIRDRWRYFVKYDDKGEPVWSSDLKQRGAVHVFPEKSKDGNYFGWTSWLPSVVWNKGLGLYTMVNGGTYAGKGMSASDEDYYSSWPHMRSGSLGLWYSKTPYGPWKQIYYTDYWTPDDPGNLIYWPKLSPKWISDDGRQMTLIYSDAMKDEKGRSHTVHYRWNQLKISLVMSK